MKKAPEVFCTKCKLVWKMLDDGKAVKCSSCGSLEVLFKKPPKMATPIMPKTHPQNQIVLHIRAAQVGVCFADHKRADWPAMP